MAINLFFTVLRLMKQCFALQGELKLVRYRQDMQVQVILHRPKDLDV